MELFHREELLFFPQKRTFVGRVVEIRTELLKRGRSLEKKNYGCASVSNHSICLGKQTPKKSCNIFFTCARPASRRWSFRIPQDRWTCPRFNWTRIQATWRKILPSPGSRERCAFRPLLCRRAASVVYHVDICLLDGSICRWYFSGGCGRCSSP